MKTLIFGFGILGLGLWSSVQASEKSRELSLNALFAPTRVAPSATYTFSGSTGDTVNFVRLCHLSNCGSDECTGPHLDITTGTPLNYNTAYHLSSQAMTNYLHNDAMEAGTYFIGLRVRSTHRNCSTSTKYCSTSADNVDQPLCLQVAYNGATVTALTQQDNGSAVLDQSTSQYGYVADFSGAVYQCALAADGTFSSCSAIATPAGAPVGWQAAAIVIETVNGTQYAYVADSEAGGNVYQCTMNASGVLTNCSAMRAFGLDALIPIGIAFATKDGAKFAYVVDENHDTYACSLNADGSFNACNLTLAADTVEASSLAFATSVHNGIATQFAYVAANNNGVQKCNLNVDGSLTDCGSTPAAGAPAWSPKGITITTVGSTQYAYVTESNANALFKCTVTSLGALSSCQSTPSSGALWAADILQGVSVGRLDGSQFVYVTGNADNLVYRCLINNDGSVSAVNCEATPDSAPSWSPMNTAFSFIDEG